jgi:uncharacterized protein YbjT (DUF2867 family)
MNPERVSPVGAADRAASRAPVFVTGGTGYLGRPLVATLLVRQHPVHALTRSGSAARLPAGAHVVLGDALDAATFAAAIPPGATVVHLVGTPHPNPAKAQEFVRVDLASIRATVTAAQQARAAHLVYVSVAHPAPIMHAFILVKFQQRYAKCHREFDKLLNSLVFSCFGSHQKWRIFSPKKWGPTKATTAMPTMS